MKCFCNVKVVLVSLKILLNLRQNDFWGNFLVGVGKATKEYNLSENTAGCFYLSANRKQLISWEVLIRELGVLVALLIDTHADISRRERKQKIPV